MRTATANTGQRQSPIEMDNDIVKAVEFLVHSANDIGRAKERAVKAEKMIGHVEALMTIASGEKTAAGREADAKASEKYVEAINEHAAAAGDLAKLYSLREAASMKVEAWRTWCATNRSYRG